MIVRCTAPIRICDLGGWTDTWFSGEGAVLNIAVHPAVEVTIETRPRRLDEHPVTIAAEDYGDRYDLDPANPRFSKHPLIEAAFRHLALPPETHLTVSIHSEAPAGASTGTSAAVSVAILGAMDLLSGRSLTAHEIAAQAHYLETRVLGLQAGVQDQLCSAYGGVHFIEIKDYPRASVSPLNLGNHLLWELESRLVLVYLGRPHSSSAVHAEVIARMENDPAFRSRLDPLRACAVRGKVALLRGDLEEFGRVMVDNTEAQRGLHADLVGSRATQVIALARDHGAIGWKVNGAGGEGGSVTLLLPERGASKASLQRAVDALGDGIRALPIRLASAGLRRWWR